MCKSDFDRYKNNKLDTAYLGGFYEANEETKI